MAFIDRFKKKDAEEQQQKPQVDVKKGLELLKEYKAAKEHLEAKIIDNEEWYKLNHWDIIRKKKKDNQEPEPVTAYLFNTIANKHADAMDNYPEPNILPREAQDEQEAKSLSDILPLVIEKNEFTTTYSNAWWYKLKQGTVAYGVFWNQELENGLGDIDIQKLDLLNVYWEPGIVDVQKSRNLFIVSLIDDDVLHEMYPQTTGISATKDIEIKKYVHDDSINTNLDKKNLVVDWYYKKKINGKTIVHLTKFVDGTQLASTEDIPEYAETGLYEHGMYPVVFDVLFPEEGTPVGFGYIDIVKNPQMYIDKFDQIIARNALQAGKQRFLVKEDGAVNEKELLDYSLDVIHTKGSINEESFKIIQAAPLHPFVTAHRSEKIAELKETSGSNDFSRGESGGGITAASAIMALQEAGNKLSRDMIKSSYNAYTKIIRMSIELVRQFYDEERKFRIEGPDGSSQYIAYNNQNLKPQPMPMMYEGQEQKYRCSVFDIKIKPERSSPFSRVAHNELAKELYGGGFFDPARAQQALVALEMMSFEGKEKIVKMINDNATFMQEVQQMQQQMQMQQQQMQQMAMLIQKLTGEDLGQADAILQQQSQQERVIKANGGGQILQR